MAGGRVATAWADYCRPVRLNEEDRGDGTKPLILDTAWLGEEELNFLTEQTSDRSVERIALRNISYRFVAMPQALFLTFLKKCEVKELFFDQLRSHDFNSTLKAALTDFAKELMLVPSLQALDLSSFPENCRSIFLEELPGSHVRSLVLSSSVGPPLRTQLEAAFAAGLHLEKLTLKECEEFYDEDCGSALLECLGQCETLKHLSISDENCLVNPDHELDMVDPALDAALASFVSQRSTLESIEVGDTEIGTATRFLDALHVHPNLRRIRFPCITPSITMMRRMKSLWLSCEKIESLTAASLMLNKEESFEGTRVVVASTDGFLPSDYFGQLLDVIREIPNVTGFTIPNHGIIDGMCTHIKSMLLDGLHLLEQLSIHLPVNEPAMNLLRLGLQDHSRLKRLALCVQNPAHMSGLCPQSKLEELLLNFFDRTVNNRFEGMATFVGQQQHLLVLEVADCDFSNQREDFMTFCTRLTCHPTLTKLVLARKRSSLDQGVEPAPLGQNTDILLDAVVESPAITALDLSDCALDIPCLVQLLPKLNKLVEFRLPLVHMCQDQADTLLQSFKQNMSIVSVARSNDSRTGAPAYGGAFHNIVCRNKLMAETRAILEVVPILPTGIWPFVLAKLGSIYGEPSPLFLLTKSGFDMPKVLFSGWNKRKAYPPA